MNFSQKYPQILIGTSSYDLALWFLEKLLAKYIVKNEPLSEEIHKKGEKLSPGLHIFNEKLHLETKYYITDLEIAITDYTIFKTPEGLNKDLENHLHSVEGIIFLEKNTKNNVVSYQNILSTFNPSMQVIFRDISEHQNAKSSKVEEFNEDDIFIETVYEKFDFVGKDLQSKGGLMSEETEGIFRIFEIIECTMWSQMRKIKNEEQKKENIQKSEQNQVKQEEIAGEKKEKPKNQKDFMEKDIDENDEMDVFVNLIQEMKEAKNQAGTLNDEERRKRAEEIMKKIMDSCKGFDDGDDEI